MHVFRLWEKVGEAGDNPRRHKEKVQGQGIELEAFFLWGASANHCTAVSGFVINNYFQIWEKNNSSRIEIINWSLEQHKAKYSIQDVGQLSNGTSAWENVL